MDGGAIKKDDDADLLVRIKSKEGQIKTTSVPFDIADGVDAKDAAEDALQSTFCLNEIINSFEIPLTQSYGDIREDVVKKIISLDSKFREK